MALLHLCMGHRAQPEEMTPLCWEDSLTISRYPILVPRSLLLTTAGHLLPVLVSPPLILCTNYPDLHCPSFLKCYPMPLIHREELDSYFTCFVLFWKTNRCGLPSAYCFSIHKYICRHVHSQPQYWFSKEEKGSSSPRLKLQLFVSICLLYQTMNYLVPGWLSWLNDHELFKVLSSPPGIANIHHNAQHRICTQ